MEEHLNDNLINEIHELKNQNQELLFEIKFIKNLILKNDQTLETTSFCPICNEFNDFKPFGVDSRENAECPTCHTLERHRLVCLLFKKRYSELLSKKINLLHFAPEPPFYKLFNNKKNINYYPVDINPEPYEKINVNIREKVNMQEIPYEDNTFDLIYNCHVLEHVPDDIKAMTELYRVLKEDGTCITLIPLFPIATTLENEKYNATPELRLKYYGHRHHLRKYGYDFKDRLESVGFNVEEVKSENLIKSDFERNLYKLANDTIYICTK